MWISAVCNGKCIKTDVELDAGATVLKCEPPRKCGIWRECRGISGMCLAGPHASNKSVVWGKTLHFLSEVCRNQRFRRCHSPAADQYFFHSIDCRDLTDHSTAAVHLWQHAIQNGPGSVVPPPGDWRSAAIEKLTCPNCLCIFLSGQGFGLLSEPSASLGGSEQGDNAFQRLAVLQCSV